ncbi:hypothetical protein L202_03265 [Cryptococcus amylolentus CBS 6039]|uniref:Uncharacterized protein n=2 Tax=Cryptococcus amylolentus TaxID=104669 RepID=A0A1E3HXX0_9TREE|nr:hypothetical protein L202_03265 [Cryptococcus amylolentus CBS 6039]ODN81174.1 hypothetical protein L202_03265 [Cryptococcus amylolentus CBS 6039]ODO09620.1 hypothetical protein I350_03228 [Cryptococcus amylolentus CBS 6273]
MKGRRPSTKPSTKKAASAANAAVSGPQNQNAGEENDSGSRDNEEEDEEEYEDENKGGGPPGGGPPGGGPPAGEGMLRDLPLQDRQAIRDLYHQVHASHATFANAPTAAFVAGSEDEAQAMAR